MQNNIAIVITLVLVVISFGLVKYNSRHREKVGVVEEESDTNVISKVEKSVEDSVIVAAPKKRVTKKKKEISEQQGETATGGDSSTS